MVDKENIESYKQAKKLWDSFNSNERIDFVEKKFAEYRELGYEVSHFRSMTAIMRDGKSIIDVRGMYHEAWAIVQMDEHLKQ